MTDTLRHTTVRKATLEDSRRIWEIRNHPVSRRYSGSSEVIPFEKHVSWFKKKYFGSDTTHHCFVLEQVASGVIGYCRLDFDDEHNHYVISIALDPAFQGRGLGHTLLSETLRQLKGGKEIFAEIQKGNTASLRLFEKNNFVRSGEDAKNYYITYKSKNAGVSTKQKTIFIVITRSFITRNILRSGTLDFLKKAGHTIVIFFDCNEIPDYIKEEFADSQVTLIALRAPVSKLHKFFIKLDRYLVCSKSTKVIIYYGMSSKERQRYRDGSRPRRPVASSWLRLTAARFLSRMRFVKKLYRYAERTLFSEKNQDVQKYFEEFKPDLLFSTSIVSGLDIAMMKEAKRRNTLTVALPKTWDNLTNLYYRLAPDYLIVYNEVLRDAAIRFQDIPKNTMRVVGMPQFDWYAKKEIVKPRVEHFRRKGLNPDLPLVFFGSSGIWSANDNKIAATIYEWIKNNELVKPCQLLVRPHFSNCNDDVFRGLRGRKGVVVDTYRISNFLVDSWDPTIEETIDFTNSVYHCDVMINLASSLALDAACCDRPIINLAFGCSFLGGKDVTAEHHYGTDHYGWVLETGATSVVNSAEELKSKINEYLLHPEHKSKERAALRQKLCYKVDGKSSERLAGAINAIMEKIYVQE